MAILAWIISMGAFLSGIGFQADAPHGASVPIATILLALACLSCPLVWDNRMMGALLSGRERAMACVALVLAAPLLFIA